jgi:hypothetical protein
MPERTLGQPTVWMIWVDAGWTAGLVSERMKKGCSVYQGGLLSSSHVAVMFHVAWAGGADSVYLSGRLRPQLRMGDGV